MPLKLFSWIRNRKKKKKEDTTIFGEPLENTPSEKSKVVSTVEVVKPKRRIHFGVLLTLKRLMAFFYVVIYIFAFFSLLPEVYALLFLGTAFLLIDYLWKTRRMKWTQPRSSEKT